GLPLLCARGLHHRTESADRWRRLSRLALGAIRRARRRCELIPKGLAERQTHEASLVPRPCHQASVLTRCCDNLVRVAHPSRSGVARGGGPLNYQVSWEPPAANA